MNGHDATIIGELRRCRANLREPAPADRAAWTMKLTMEEVDALLRAVDERDELRRQTVGDLETGIDPVRVETMSLGEHGIATVPERFQPATRYPGVHTITSCPHAGTHHSCPLGGCPTKEPRTVTIPDLPKQGMAEKVTRELVDNVGREARETPPEPSGSECDRCGEWSYNLDHIGNICKRPVRYGSPVVCGGRMTPVYAKPTA